jgi:hypothetical protein
MKQQTSVEWLFETMAKIPMTDWYEVLQKAKEMEKKQIIDAYNATDLKVTKGEIVFDKVKFHIYYN